MKRITVADIDIRDHVDHSTLFVIDPDGQRWFHSTFPATARGRRAVERLRGKLQRKGTAWVSGPSAQ